MPFPLIVEALDLGDVLFFLFNNISIISTYCKRVIVTTSLTLLMLKTSLIVLVFLASLALVNRRLLVFAIRYVSGKSVSGLSPFGVFLLLFRRLIPLRILWIYFLGAEGWLQQCFYLCINGFLNGFFPKVQFPALSIQLCLNKKFQTFPKVSDQNLFVQSCNRIELL